MDRNMNNAITSSDILHFLRDNTIYSVSESEAHRLIRYYVDDLDFSLTYKDFSQLLLPCENTVLRNSLLARRPYARVSRYQFLHRDIEHALCELLLEEIQLARHID